MHLLDDTSAVRRTAGRAVLTGPLCNSQMAVGRRLAACGIAQQAEVNSSVDLHTRAGQVIVMSPRASQRSP